MKKVLMGMSMALLLAACGTTTTNQATTAQTPQTTQAPHVEVKTDGTYTVKEYDFDSNGKDIYARAFVPDASGRVPLVIFSHGLGADARHEEEVQKTLAKAGIAVFSFEFAGGSSSSVPMSEGLTTEMSVLTEVQNLKDAIRIASGMEYVDPQKIYLMGSSQGGLVTALAAEEVTNIAGLFLFYPAFSLPDDIRSSFPKLDEVPETFNLLGTKIGKIYITDIYDMDPYANLDELVIPVHIYHGKDDNIVPLTASQKAMKRLKDARLTTLDDTGHALTPEQQAQIGFEIADEIYNGMK
ncbi:MULTISPECIES: alpha/beta fold hydrolase [unclassified Granulicatella]|uniref:alpha/beta hydrolase family protein n=1 Tax=unclassified Granulicatella TaxID=2630493 RepID=UPI00255226C2|nr:MULTISPECIES: alpha/beta fold hydrolase [unclassified Granulicatella]MDK8380932.1 alpha/beta fold hydrolase [Granulicatella sp. UMB5615B]MDK8521996.1 alpha/beta fold hydrolase [Granulicatella sp. UMB5615A]